MISPMLNDIVDFQLVTNGVLGDERTDCTIIVPSMTYQAARLMDPEIVVKHQALYSYFQSKVPGDDPSSYQYFSVQLANGAMEVIGYPWVNEPTFKVVQGRTRTIVITNWQEKMASPTAKFLRDLGASYTSHDTVVS